MKRSYYPIPAGGSTDFVPPRQNPATIAIPEEGAPPVEPQQQQPEGQPPTEPTPPTPRVFTEEELERARKEEKDKLYPRIQEMQDELKRLREAEEAKKKAQEDAERKTQEEQKRKQEEQMELRELLSKKEQEWNERLEKMEQERQRERAIMEQERRLTVLSQYRDRKLAENADNIMPELRDMVQGNSEEEIDRSINLVIEKTNRILEQVTAGQQVQRQQQRTVAPTGSPPVGPIEQNDQAYRTLTPEEIQNMDINEYAKNRDKLLGAVFQQAKQQGIYS